MNEYENDSNKTQRPGSWMQNPILLGITSLRKIRKWEQRQYFNNTFRTVHIKETKKEEDAKGQAWTYGSKIVGTEPGCSCSKHAGQLGKILCQNKNKPVNKDTRDMAQLAECMSSMHQCQSLRSNIT